jgi:hypothetical protein
MLSAPITRAWKRFALVVSATLVVVAMAVPAHAASLTQTWAKRYVGGTDFQYAKSLAVSPDGGTVYVTGISAGPKQEGDPYDVFATIAYDTGNGQMRWIDRYAFAHVDNWASTIVVTPDGQRVFVTGATPDGYPIVAYDATTGHRLWVRSVMPAGYVGFEGTLAVSPDSKLVYFSGEVQVGDGPDSRLVTRAYTTVTGVKVWGVSVAAPAGLQVTPRAMAVDRGGLRLFITGAVGNLQQYPSTNPPDFVTVGLNATTGVLLWTRVYDGPAKGGDDPAAITVTPDGHHVLVAGSSGGASGLPQYAVVSYAAATGTPEWVARDGAQTAWRSAAGMAMNPSATVVYVTGTESTPSVAGARYSTVAFAVSGGAKLWSRAFTGPTSAVEGKAVVVSPDGLYVYVTGQAYRQDIATYATVAYVASTGDRITTAWYLGTQTYALPEAIGVSPSGDVFVTGRGGGAFATVAYDLG